MEFQVLEVTGRLARRHIREPQVLKVMSTVSKQKKYANLEVSFQANHTTFHEAASCRLQDSADWVALFGKGNILNVRELSTETSMKFIELAISS